MERLRNTLLSMRDLLVTAGPVLLLGLALIGLAYWILDPTPPKHMTLATGPAQGAYAEFGRRYAQALKPYGIDVQLHPTRGSQENLTLLQAGEVDAAFIQGGADEIDSNLQSTDSEDKEPPDLGLYSLGSLFREPVWVFYREATARKRLKRPTLDSLSQLAGWRLNIGHEGSGVTNLMRRLLAANGVEPNELQLGRLEPTPAVVALLDGKIDALAFVSAPESPLVQMLLITPGIRLLDFAQAEAYARRVPQVSPVLLPRGVVNLAKDLPGQDVRLVASTATLVVRDSTHPALQHLLVQAAQRIHGTANWFQRKGEFPHASSGEYPLADEAARFYRSGPSLMQRWLPFWAVNLLDRMWVVVISIAALLIPLSRVVPPLYIFRVRSRIFKWYGILRQLEVEFNDGKRDPAELLEELGRIDERVAKLPVPLSYADELYALRSHISALRLRVQTAAALRNRPAN
jgi:TRAP transporter TAXI family solute receptor